MEISDITKTTIVSRSHGIAARMFEGHMLVITAKDSKLHRFNNTGTFIWNILEKPVTVSEVCTDLSRHFEGFKTDNNIEIFAFLLSLQAKGLITLT